MITLVVLMIIVGVVLYRAPNLNQRYAKCDHCRHQYWKHHGRDETCMATYKGLPSCNCPRWSHAKRAPQHW